MVMHKMVRIEFLAQETNRERQREHSQTTKKKKKKAFVFHLPAKSTIVFDS